MSLKKALLFLATILFSNNAFAGTECDLNFFGQRVCVVGVEDFDDQEAESSQEKNQWCWAASISMIFKYHGYNISQKEIVKQTYGKIINLPATGKKIGQNIKKSYKTHNGQEVKVSVKEFDAYSGKFSMNNKDVLLSLEQGRPLIIGANGHAMVLTAVYYTRNPDGKLSRIIGATVRDPWPGQGKRELRMNELSPFYVADIIVGHSGETRIGQCKDACFTQKEDCEEIANDENETCNDNCEDLICDRCSYYDDYLYESCDQSCGRCKRKCERSIDTKSNACDSKRRVCEDRCEAN